ncbi:multidrug efflux pump subunit AcrB [Alkalispirillum mobile]|uniref:Multidrug efflux pump subunit AcrB n=1 Tax=Alkalispirillum mobile TaxID=85925 RepID=A0A498CCQ4_9GAMM|nr:efflux RND transporter permease subunit [Alkalispirillum mobile]RLK50178.1 multidrug efflux pump subunit AcrB [Alkalispirillum mobile]
MSRRATAGSLAWFSRHAVAANLVLLLMVVGGLYALSQLNTQFFPNFELDIVNVEVEWQGATAEDVADGITRPLEDELRDLDGLREMVSTSAEGISVITLEFSEGTDMAQAVEDAKERVGRVRNLPPDSETPTINRVTRYDPIARVLLTGDLQPDELRGVARDLEESLLQSGVARVQVTGLPDEEIRITTGNDQLLDLGLSFDRFAGLIGSQSRDLPAGEVGEADVARQLRSLEQRRSVAEFENLQLSIDGRNIMLGDIASVERLPRDGEIEVYYQGRPAVELLLERAEQEDALDSARILEDWVAETQPTLPPGVELQVFDESWELISERIGLLVKNGLSGLLLVVGILFVFLSGRVAFWVTVGIPASFLAALTVLWLVGGSINMMSLFALIMTLGIIVDDAIVVGEDGLAHYQRGEGPWRASEGGARRMLPPVVASSLTTIAAFLPLMAVGGVIGNILFDIPLVVVCVIIASLVEAFLVLPGHLRRSFEAMQRPDGGWPGRIWRLFTRQRSQPPAVDEAGRALRPGPGPVRRRIDGAFDRFRDGYFIPAVQRALAFRWTTIAVGVALVIGSVGLVAGGRIAFTFFPNVEGTILNANTSFVAGTPRERTKAYLERLESALLETEEALGGELLRGHLVYVGKKLSDGTGTQDRGDHYGSIMVELVSPDARDVSNSEFMAEWRERVPAAAGLEDLVIQERMAGPPGDDLDIRLIGPDIHQLKTASEALQETLASYAGVSAISDDLPWGQEQWIYSLTEEGRALGLDVAEIGSQLRATYLGELVQIFHERRDEVEVRVRLDEGERRGLAALSDFRVQLPDGGAVPLDSVAQIDSRRGFEALRHIDARQAVTVTADVDAAVANANRILADLEASALPDLAAQHGLEYSFGGRAQDQEETLADMRTGLVLALTLIYIILAWIFGSYGWPLVVMAVIPFSLVGAFLGHWVMGLDLTILSLFGLFGLTGIVVNNSIILVVFYRQLREQRRMSADRALVEASRQRLRPVLLTSLTTIGGLLPLLFETSVQAQFLIPMAVSIAGGLAGATLLVLFLVPAMLSVYESAAERLNGGADNRFREATDHG